MKDPVFAKTVSAKNVRIGQRSLQNHNKLLWRVDGADGVKTGFTKAAGRILVSSASRDGRRVICVTINDGNDWVDHAKLLEMGFSQYTLKQIVHKGDYLGSIEVAGGTAGCVSVYAAEDFSYPISDTEKPEIVLQGAGFVYAPVVEGAQAGYAYVMVDGASVGKIPLVFGQTVERTKEDKLSLLDKIMQLFR
jgi:D-alanyl-D-alanine carboxypeptidase